MKICQYYFVFRLNRKSSESIRIWNVWTGWSIDVRTEYGLRLALQSIFLFGPKPYDTNKTSYKTLGVFFRTIVCCKEIILLAFILCLWHTQEISVFQREVILVLRIDRLVTAWPQCCGCCGLIIHLTDEYVNWARVRLRKRAEIFFSSILLAFLWQIFSYILTRFPSDVFTLSKL
jgi:hypothetical protein